MNKYITSIFALCLSIGVFAHGEMHRFTLSQGKVNIEASINSYDSYFDYYELNVKHVNICFYDLNKISDFKDQLEYFANDSTQTECQKFDHYFIKKSNGKISIADVSGKYLTLNQRQLDFILLSTNYINDFQRNVQ